MAFRLWRQPQNLIRPARNGFYLSRFYANSSEDGREDRKLEVEVLTRLLEQPFQPASSSSSQTSPEQSDDDKAPVGPSFSPDKIRTMPRSRQIQKPDLTGSQSFFQSRPDFFGPSASEALVDLPEYKLYAQCTPNNVIMTFTNDKGMTKGWVSGGSVGFSNAQRSTYEAGYQCAVRIFKIVEEVAKEEGNGIKLHVLYKGRGQARDALHKAILGDEGNAIRPMVFRITDRTPIKIGGTRAKKRRRL